MDKHKYNSNLPYFGNYKSYPQSSQNQSRFQSSYQRSFNSPFQSQSKLSSSSNFRSNNSFHRTSVWNESSIPSLLSYSTTWPDNTNAPWSRNQNPFSGNNPAWIQNNGSSNWFPNNQLMNIRDVNRSRRRQFSKPTPTTSNPKFRKNNANTKNNSNTTKKDTNTTKKNTRNRSAENSKVSVSESQGTNAASDNKKSFWKRKRKRPASNKPPEAGSAAKKAKPDAKPAATAKTSKGSTRIEGVLVAIIINEFPIKRLSSEETEKFNEAFKAEKEKVDPTGNLVKNVLKKKGSLFVICKDKAGVECVKNIAQSLTPWEGRDLRVVLPVDRDSKKWIAIVPGSFPSRWFTLDEMQLIETALERELNTILKDEFHPEFLDYYKRRGSMLLACNNELSVDWLKTIIPELKAFEGDQPRTIDANDLPSYCKIEFLLPTTSDKVEHMLERMNRQNEGLDTGNWYVIRQSETENGIKLIASIERDVHTNLKLVKLKPFLNFGTVDIKYLGSLKGPYSNKQMEVKEEIAKVTIKTE